MKSLVTKLLELTMLLVSFNVCAQSKIALFYDQNGKGTNVKNNAVFYRLVGFDRSNNPIGVVEDFYMNDKPLAKGAASVIDKNDNSRSRWKGKVLMFSETGYLLEENNYDLNGLLDGPQITYDPNGAITQELEYLHGYPIKDNHLSRKQKEDSNITEFAKKPIAIILTIIIAFLGGVPGVIALKNYFNQKPVLTVRQGPTQNGVIEHPNGHRIPFFFITCNIVNTGGKPLFPTQFMARVRYDNKEADLLPTVAPVNFKGHTSDGTQFNYNNSSEDDLQKLKKLSPDEAVYGILFFTTTIDIQSDYSRADKRYITISCIDVFDKSYSSGFVNSGPVIKGKVSYPKNNLNVDVK